MRSAFSRGTITGVLVLALRTSRPSAGVSGGRCDCPTQRWTQESHHERVDDRDGHPSLKCVVRGCVVRGASALCPLRFQSLRLPGTRTGQLDGGKASKLWCADGRHRVTRSAPAGWEPHSAARGAQRRGPTTNNNRGNSTRSLAGERRGHIGQNF
jgi:hypothetical protein